jgi:ABC-type Fe3+ transport system substrate-binding protein
VKHSRPPLTLLVAFLAALALIAAACGDDTEPAETPAAPDPADEDPGDPDPADEGDPAAWDAGAPEEWEDLLEAARAEGQVTVAGPAALASAMAAAFEADTGITLNWVSVTGGEHHARILQEHGSGQMSIDISFSPSVPTMMYPQGALAPIRPLLVLPSVTDTGNWANGELKFNDPEGEYIFQTAEYVHGWAMVNTDEVDPEELQDWEDLLNPEYQGRIASHVATSPGPGEAISGYLWAQFGEDFVMDLYVGQDVAFSSDSRQLAEWIARGEYAIALGGVQHDFERFRDEGFNIEPAVPGYLSGGFSPVSHYEGAPHPNAAAVFLNWYASPAGQMVYQDVMLETSRRVDLPTEGIPFYVDPDAYPHSGFDGYEWTYYAEERPGITEALSEALGGR